MIRKLLLFTVLLTLGCRAQGPAINDAELNSRVERQVRSMVQAPSYVGIKITGRKPSPDFQGYDILTVTLSAGERSQPVEFLISKDNRTMYQLPKKIDLGTDPYKANMEAIDVSGRPIRGNKDAKVTVVVYDDYQCPYCSRMHLTMIDAAKQYGDRVRFIYKDFPLDFHPWAMRAAIDSQCLAAQSSDAYWDFTDFVHANPSAMGDRGTPVEKQFAALDKIAEDTGRRHSVDPAKLSACITQQQLKDKVDASIAEATKLGVEGTPAFFVNGMKSGGAVPANEFNAMLDQALAEAGVPKPAKAEAGK